MKLLEIINKYYYHKKLLPLIFQDYFVTNNSVHQYNTRNKFSLHLPIVNSVLVRDALHFEETNIGMIYL